MSSKDWRKLLGGGEKAGFERLLDAEDGPESQRLRIEWPKRLLIANIIFFVASLGCLFASRQLYLRKDDNILRQSTFYSAPVTDTFLPEWTPQQYETHPIESEESIFRQDPSDEVDAAWDRITDIGVLAISDEDVRRLGKDPETVVKAPESWGRGSDARLAHLDGLHLLHCLNSMRQNLHANFDRYHPNGKVSDVHHSHLSHCQEALTKHLMCQPSVELITFNWVKRQVHPFPDFDLTRKCINFDSLLEWQAEKRVHSMTSEKWAALEKPEDVTPLPVPLLMLEAYNITREEEAKLDDDEWGPHTHTG